MTDIDFIYDRILHYGNRQDYELNADDWMSWSAIRTGPHTAIVEVYGDSAPTVRYRLRWSRA